MKFVVSQKVFNEAITVVQKAVSNKTTLPILKSIFIEAADGKLRLIGNDLSIGIEMTIDAEVDIPGQAVVSSKILGEIIRKLPDADVFISSDEQHNIDIKCLQSKFHLAGFAPEEYPDLPVIEEGNQYDINKHLFKDMIRQTIFATSQDETRPILTGSLLEIENSEMTMVSIDLYRVAIRKAKVHTNVDCKAVIPAKTLSELLKLLSLSENDEDIKLYQTDKHMQFELSGITIITRLLEGEFIKYNQIMPKEHNSVVTVATNELYQAIDRASLLAKEGKNTSVKFQINDDALLITSNVEIGSVNEMVKIELEGPDLEIGFNPKYWMDVLKVIDTDTIQIELTTNVSPCIVRPFGSEHYTYLVLPVRIPN